MSRFDEDSNEEVIINGADFAQMVDEIKHLHAECDRLTTMLGPQQPVSAEEVTEQGFYLVRASIDNLWVPCLIVRLQTGDELGEFGMLLIGHSELFRPVGETIPIKMPEVQK